MAERAHAPHIPPGRYSKRLGEGTSPGAAGGVGAADGAGTPGAGGAASAARGAGAGGGAAPGSSFSIRNFLAVFKYSRRALELVWSTNRFLAVVLGLLTIVA